MQLPIDIFWKLIRIRFPEWVQIQHDPGIKSISTGQPFNRPDGIIQIPGTCCAWIYTKTNDGAITGNAQCISYGVIVIVVIDPSHAREKFPTKPKNPEVKN